MVFDLNDVEKCCSICDSAFYSEGSGCGANDLSEAEYWEMKAEVYNGLQVKQY